MDKVQLRADCARCNGLCCVALTFDRSALFGFDKPAGTACRHLTGADRCAIHAALDASGFSGCRRYDCLGAGQRVTEEIFPGLSWRDGPATARAVFHAFGILRDVHARLLQLHSLANLPAGPEAVRQSLLAALDPREGWSYAGLLLLERSAVPAAAQAFLSSRSATAP